TLSIVLFCSNDTPTTEIYTLSLHDALPISAMLKRLIQAARERRHLEVALSAQVHAVAFYRAHGFVEEGGVYEEAGIAHQAMRLRSEEHTSELQSRENLVCRLLLEKKKEKKR